MQKEGAAKIHTFILTETFEKNVDIVHEKPPDRKWFQAAK